MEGFLWSSRTLEVFLVIAPFFCLHLLVTFAIERPEFIMLFATSKWRAAFGSKTAFQPRSTGEKPTGLVVVPSLLRGADDLNAITTTIESCATNQYPTDLLIVASVDGRTEHPKLYAELTAWIEAQSYPSNVTVRLTGTEIRLGKMMAVEAGVHMVHDLVANNVIPEFPKVYFSVDGDGILGPHALERLADKLNSRTWLTKNKHRIVSGKLAIRPDLIWRGWRAFLTVEGQIYQQVAREFVCSNMMRFNKKLFPQIGVPGALYCCWSEMLVMAPYYMGFMRTLRMSHVAKWWIGFGPPKFSESKEPPSAEALTGASDDTCMAFLASMATWKDGKLSLDAPRTPLHALVRLFVSFWLERSHAYEPEARIYTFTPNTVKGLWVQRVRWNSSRFECAGRFAKGFWFHWEISFATALHLLLVLRNVGRIALYYILFPYLCFGHGHVVLGFVYGYMFHMFEDALYTMMSFAIERDWRRSWRSAMCLPLTPLYTIVISNISCAYGVFIDLFVYGNPTKFAPEATLIKGQTARVALLFRARRFLALTVRSALVGDVPFGGFWFGWRETAWTPNGFEGWTTGKKPRSIVPWSALLRRAPVVASDNGSAGDPASPIPTTGATVHGIGERASISPRTSRQPPSRRAA